MNYKNQFNTSITLTDSSVKKVSAPYDTSVVIGYDEETKPPSEEMRVVPEKPLPELPHRHTNTVQAITARVEDNVPCIYPFLY